jgi:hypothetical protein
MNNVQNARVRKTKLLFENPAEFAELLIKDLVALESQASKAKVKPALRLNGTSDIYWPDKIPQIFDRFPNLTHYNYTKEVKVMKKYMDKKCPPNYYLIFSRSEDNWDFCKTVLQNKHTIATVFDKVPKEYEGFKVFDADETDLRFLDPPGQIAGLKSKGRAKKDSTGFVIK